MTRAEEFRQMLEKYPPRRGDPKHPDHDQILVQAVLDLIERVEDLEARLDD